MPRGLIIILVLLCGFIIFLIFRLFTVTQSLNDVTMILVEQVVSLREWCILRRYMSRKPAMFWDHDALYVHGRKGDLLIRRHALQRHWAEQYSGNQTEEQQRIRKMINEIDEQLISYGIYLQKVTALTECMIENLYHGSDQESIMVIKNIMRDLRRL